MNNTARTLRSDPVAGGPSPGLLPFSFHIALLLSAAIAISYLDRQTLPWAIKAIQSEIPITNQLKASVDSAFLIADGLMYLGGGAWIGEPVGDEKGGVEGGFNLVR